VGAVLAAAPHQVWARVVWAAIDTAVMGGLPRDELFAGLPFDESSVRKLKRVSWNDYCKLCENIDKLAGGEVADLLEAGYHQSYPEIRAIAGAFLDSKLLMRFMMVVGNPFVFPSVEHGYEDLGGRHVRVTARLVAGARPCEAWFRGTIGALRGVPRYLDLPPAEVSAQIGPDFGVYDVTLPQAQRLRTRVREGLRPIIRMVLGREADGREVGALIGELEDNSFETSLQAAHLRWKLTPRQLEILRHLARGQSNWDIAQTLECAESTVELHVAQLLRKTRASSRDELVALMLES
jgi:DNA-binding CsgD family transcriptional regulator